MTTESLVKSAEGKWDEVERVLKEYIDSEKVKGADVENGYFIVCSYIQTIVKDKLTIVYQAINNLSVALLGQGKVKEVCLSLTCQNRSTADSITGYTSVGRCLATINVYFRYRRANALQSLYALSSCIDNVYSYQAL